MSFKIENNCGQQLLKNLAFLPWSPLTSKTEFFIVLPFIPKSYLIYFLHRKMIKKSQNYHLSFMNFEPIRFLTKKVPIEEYKYFRLTLSL